MTRSTQYRIHLVHSVLRFSHLINFFDDVALKIGVVLPALDEHCSTFTEIQKRRNAILMWGNPDVTPRLSKRPACLLLATQEPPRSASGRSSVDLHSVEEDLHVEEFTRACAGRCVEALVTRRSTEQRWGLCWAVHFEIYNSRRRGVSFHVPTLSASGG